MVALHGYEHIHVFLFLFSIFFIFVVPRRHIVANKSRSSVGAVVVVVFVVHCFDHVRHDLLSAHLPFSSIYRRVRQVLIAGLAKHSAILQLLRQRDDVEIEEAQLALVPSIDGIRVRTASLVGGVAFTEEALVPLAVHVPVLHGVSDVAGLDEMLDDDVDVDL
eukprot:CAMPEP_0119571778 /NCGR_PEP_ID=MMETSP1352-20130426/44286_1 /TAXON_ID=265584 /ORGANISM="Stauroneis constricta, Strain CCMP1120" /LENGTH=162 /DNA_ID=CAMNT_0007621461 /DNA_START=817 /DNA_END=1305 /DNA_ORIENTATION=+